MQMLSKSLINLGIIVDNVANMLLKPWELMMHAESRSHFSSQASSVEHLLKLVRLANWQGQIFLDKMTVTA